eukprot:TRINITY_DN11257_c0_g1_i1.p1 TRINITY_DN11257_c0_g1~~TRINITY_DN11257_c0_g1_i1.p1  ORF type:complete len:722 (+),score=105.93 TRINITY_DN11257_c0_g1_i1:37-2166(+)
MANCMLHSLPGNAQGPLDLCTLPAEIEDVSRIRRRVRSGLIGVLLGAVAVSAATNSGCGTAVSNPLVKQPTGRRLQETLSVHSPGDADFFIFSHIGDLAQLNSCLEFSFSNLLMNSTANNGGILVMYVMPQAEWAAMVRYVQQVVETRNHTVPNILRNLNQTCYRDMVLYSSSVNRIRILSPLDFKDLLLNIRYRLGHDLFQKWFSQTTYDAPKLVDSIMRIRAIDNSLSIPVLRFDSDVLCSAVTKKDNMRSIQNAVAQGIKDYHHSTDDPEVTEFIISQQYSGVDVTKTAEFDSWNEGFSTRSAPALLATPALLNVSQWSAKGFTPSSQSLQQATNEDVMLKFYGLTKTHAVHKLLPRVPSTKSDVIARKEEDLLNLGNTYIGANPARAIISGAALCTSPGIPLSMPPYIHADLNIMWIDDHILDKTAQEVLHVKRHDSPADAGTAEVVKARSHPKNVAKHTLENYMPTLMYGIIMDAWTNRNVDSHLLKYSRSDLPDELQERYDSLIPHGTAQGTYTKALQDVMRTGLMLEGAELNSFKAKLWNDALERIKETYYQWTSLPAANIEGRMTPTFATLWIAGRVCDHPGLEFYCNNSSSLHKGLGGGMISPAWDARAAKLASAFERLPVLTQEDLLPAMRAKVDQLIETVCTHLQWVRVWPSVVQAARNDMQGALPSDLEWHFTNTLQRSLEHFLGSSTAENDDPVHI